MAVTEEYEMFVDANHQTWHDLLESAYPYTLCVECVLETVQEKMRNNAGRAYGLPSRTIQEVTFDE